jgi:hypothetical protein
VVGFAARACADEQLGNFATILSSVTFIISKTHTRENRRVKRSDRFVPTPLTYRPYGYKRQS